VRVLTTLSHREPDKVPFDFGSTPVTGITIGAYRNLLHYLGIKEKGKDIVIFDPILQLAKIKENILERFDVDTRGVSPGKPSNWDLVTKDRGDYLCLTDEWGIGWRMPKIGGHYYDMFRHPLQGEICKEDIDSYPWPNPIDRERINGIAEGIGKLKSKNFANVVQCFWAGFFEACGWLRGFGDFFMDLAGNISLACYLMDELLELRIRYWDTVLDKFGKEIQVVMEADDLGGQKNLLISPQMYRKYVKPRHNRLFSFIKSKAPNAYIFLHSCGSVYDIVPDLIEAGVDILNPVQVSAAKMNTRKLKKEFGKDLVFWGGGVDTQKILPRGNVREVKDEVKKRIDDLAPGGGFVFATVHNIQDDVPPENIRIMWETLQKYGIY